MTFSWKTARDIMRADSNVSTEYQRLEQFVSLVFLRIYNALEEEWADEADSEGRDYTPALPDEYQWDAWALPDAAGKALTGEELVLHLNALYRHCATMSVVGLEPRQKIVRRVFEGLTQHMRDGYQLRQLIDLVNSLNYHDARQRHLFGQMYEEMLRIMQSSKETGEYYTPRAVTQFIVEQLNPRLGERFGDFACGTGGFLTAAIDHLHRAGVSTKKEVEQLQQAIVGCELKSIPYLLCATNLLVHGIDNPTLTSGTAFSKNINDYDDCERVDVIGMNPPYGGMTTATELTNFPENVRTSETAVLFLAYICKRLREGGRAGVIIPDGFLFGSDGASVEVKKTLLQHMNLHTIVRLPSSVFAPYTSITTNILFFDNRPAPGAPDGFRTKDVWVYRLDMPEGYKHFSKTKPILPEHMQPLKEWWLDRRELTDPTDDPARLTYKARCFTAAEIAESGYNLDLCKYPKEEEVILTPDELLADYHERRTALDAEISRRLSSVGRLISGDDIESCPPEILNPWKDLGALTESLPDKLRKSVLQEAIHGRLVPNTLQPGELTARELLNDILATRQKTENETKGKKAKKLTLNKIEEEPWELPEGWCWCRLGDVFEIVRGGSPRPINEFLTSAPDGYNWIKIGDTEKNGKYINASKEKIIKEGLKKTRLVHSGDLLLTNSMSFGRPYILNIDGCIHDGWLVLSPYLSELDKEFFFYLLSTPYVYAIFAEKAAGGVVTNLKTEKVFDTTIPLPPLSIQHEIVSKIEEIFAVLDSF